MRLYDSLPALFPRHYGALTHYLHRLGGQWVLFIPVTPETRLDRLIAHGLEALGDGRLINEAVEIGHVSQSIRDKLSLPQQPANGARYCIWHVKPRFSIWARFDNLLGRYTQTQSA